MLAASALMPVNIKAGRVRKVPPPAKAFWMPAHTATRKRRISPVMVPLWHSHGGAGNTSVSKLGGYRLCLACTAGNQVGAAHRFAQIAGGLAPAIRRRLIALLVLFLRPKTHRHRKSPPSAAGIIRSEEV